MAKDTTLDLWAIAGAMNEATGLAACHTDDARNLLKHLHRAGFVVKAGISPDLTPFTFRVFWFADDAEWVGACDQFPSLSHLDADPVSAMAGIRRLVVDCLNDMDKDPPA